MVLEESERLTNKRKRLWKIKSKQFKGEIPWEEKKEACLKVRKKDTSKINIHNESKEH